MKNPATIRQDEIRQAELVYASATDTGSELPAQEIQRAIAELTALSDAELEARGLNRGEIGYVARYCRPALVVNGSLTPRRCR